MSLVKAVVVVVGSGGSRTPTEMLSSVTDWKQRGDDSLQG